MYGTLSHFCTLYLIPSTLDRDEEEEDRQQEAFYFKKF